MNQEDFHDGVTSKSLSLIVTSSFPGHELFAFEDQVIRSKDVLLCFSFC